MIRAIRVVGVATALGMAGLHTAHAESTIRVLGADGVPTPARVVVLDEEPVAADGARLRVAPDGGAYFYTTGVSTWSGRAPGRVRIQKGLDHVPAERALVPGMNEVKLERPFDSRALGYFSGDGHVHPMYLGTRHESTNAEILLAMKGEDLNVVNALAGNALSARVYWKSRVRGRDEPESEPDYRLRVSVEYRSNVFGHLAVFGAKSPPRLPYSAFPGTPRPFDFPLNHDAARAYQRAGAFVSFAHLRDAPDRALEAPADVALGVVRAVEIMGYAVPTPEARRIWERLLASGFDVVLTAGTDAVMGAAVEPVIGGARTFARLGGAPLGYDRFVAALEAGRGFTTSGPLVLLRVGGKRPGESLALEPGEVRPVDVEVEVLSVFPWRRLVLRHGAKDAMVFESAPGVAARQVFRGRLEVAGPGWIHAEVEGGLPHHTLAGRNLGRVLAITNPVWIRSGNATRRDPASARSFVRWIERDLALLETRDNYGSPEKRRIVRETLTRALRIYRRRAASPATP